MITTLEIRLTAARPQMPLSPWFAFKDSPSSVRVIDVPKKVGAWDITGVQLQVLYPDNITVTKNAVRSGSCWVATVEGSGVAGKVVQGYQVTASGTDEDGNPVEGYVLGCGDVFIMEVTNDMKALVGKSAVRFLDDLPVAPVAGDMVLHNGGIKFYDGEEWINFGNAEDIPTKVSQLENDVGYITASAIPSKVSDFENDAGYLTANASTITNLENDLSAVSRRIGEVAANVEVLGSEMSELGASVSAMAVTIDAKRDYLDLTYPATVNSNINDGFGVSAFTLKFDDPTVIPTETLQLNSFAVSDGYAYWRNTNETNYGSWFVRTSDGHTYEHSKGENPIIQAFNFTLDDFLDGSVSTYEWAYIESVGKRACTINGTLKRQNTKLALLTDIPSVPTNVGAFTNDVGYVTAQTVASTYYNKVEVSAFLSTKQDELDTDELSMISQVTDERKTVITFTDNTSEEYEWSGEITRQNIVDAGLWEVEHGGWIREPLSIKVGTAVTSLGNYAFANAHYLTSIDIPSTVTNIGQYCLYDCSALTGITIPYSMKVIGSDTFGLCSSLTSVTIPNSVESIGATAFENCTSLSTLLIPDSVKSIGYRAFVGCTNLTNLKIPDNVTSIGAGAFQGSGIQTITIGSSVASIGEDAFYNAAGVTSVVFRGKTLTQVQAMTNYPWDISDTSIIKTWNDATQEWVNQEYRGKSDLDYTNVNWNSDTAQFGIDYFTLNFGGHIFTLDVFQTGKHAWTNASNQFKVVASDKNNFIVTQPPYNDRTIATFTRSSESEVSWNLTSSQESGSSTFTVTAYPLTSTKIALSNSVPTKTSDLVNDSGFIDTAPTVNNGTLYIYQNNVLLGTFTANQHETSSINITAGGGTQVPVLVELADPSQFPSPIQVGNCWFQAQDAGYWYVSLNGSDYVKMSSIQTAQLLTIMVQPDNGQITIDAPTINVWDGSSWTSYSGYAQGIDVSNVEWISVLTQ